ncbi:Annexin [Ancylostoma caninum]|uniref:Annexin n=1 Tax=Ancylostoma caninum TaxID=29170 RepID=A0A368H5M8_ANCCA|nr:Annexin [Ancylostoma caninum]
MPDLLSTLARCQSTAKQEIRTAPTLRHMGGNLSTGSSIDSDTSHHKRRLMPMMYQMYESQYEDLRGTIYGPDSPDFHPAQASETLRKALSGMDTKDQIVINTLLYHNNFQRQKILSAYEDMYGRKLIDDLEEETGGYFLEMVQALFKPAHQYDTLNLYRSLSNRYADRSVAIEIACTRSSRQLRVIRETYHNDFKKTLEKDIAVKVEGVVGRMLTMLLCKSRDEDGKKIDDQLVETHAKLLVNNSLDELAKNLTLFEQIFTGNSWKHIGAVFDRVDELRSGERDIETLIRKNKVLHSEIRQIFLTIIRVSRNMQLYFAELLRAAMTGDRPDHQTIIRITVSRSEIDLYDIAEEYKRKYNRALEYDIQQTCSGDYMRLVSALLSASNNNNNISIM